MSLFLPDGNHQSEARELFEPTRSIVSSGYAGLGRVIVDHTKIDPVEINLKLTDDRASGFHNLIE